MVNLLGEAGGFTTAGLKYDGHGGTMLALGNGASIDFNNVNQNALTAADFKIG